MSRKKLTAKQHVFLQFLIRYTREEDVWPTYREITDHFGYRSPNSVTQNLKALQKKGYLTRDVFEEVTVLGGYVGHVNDRGIFKQDAA